MLEERIFWARMLYSNLRNVAYIDVVVAVLMPVFAIQPIVNHVH